MGITAKRSIESRGAVTPRRDYSRIVLHFAVYIEVSGRYASGVRPRSCAHAPAPIRVLPRIPP